MGMALKIIELQQADSTNNYLLSLHPQPAEDVVVATAKYQTAGRGQGTNKWESEDGKNLLASVLVHPRGIDAARQFSLSMAGALAVADTLGQYISGVSLKWPNDVYWRDCKISGTLIETRLAGREIRDCVFGVGINVNQREFRGDAPNPVSLRQILGHDVPLGEFAERFVASFVGRYEALLGGGISDIGCDYRAMLYRRQGLHAYEDSHGRFVAAMEDVADDGHLLLRDDSGSLRTYAFKEVKYII